MLGAKWNPELYNECYRADEDELRIEIQQGLGDVWFVEVYR